jgi:hypothetical protein
LDDTIINGNSAGKLEKVLEDGLINPIHDTISNVDIENNNIKWASVDTIDTIIKPYTCAICNTDLSANGGKHWFSIITINDNTVYIIDPLGKNNKRSYDNIMYETLKKAGIDNILWCDTKVQMRTSYHCGWFSVYICKYILEPLIKMYYDKLTPQIISRKMKSVFGASSKPSYKQYIPLVKAFGLQKK